MGMLANYMEADAELINKMKGMTAEDIFELVEELEDEGELLIAELGKMWDGLHFLLTGVSASKPIEDDLISEAIVGECAFDGEDEYIAYIYPDRLKKIYNALQEVDIDRLKEKFSPEKFAEKEIYPDIWVNDDKERLLEELLEAFECIKTFYGELVLKNKGVIVSIY